MWEKFEANLLLYFCLRIKELLLHCTVRLSRIVSLDLPYSRQQYPTVLQVFHSIITETEAGSETGAEIVAETGAETKAESGAEAGAEIGAQTGVESGAQTGAQTAAQTGAESGAETGAETRVRPQALSNRQLVNARLTNNSTTNVLPPTLLNRQLFSRTGLPIEAMDGHLRSRLEMGEDLSGAMQMSRTPVVHTGAEFRPQTLLNRQLANARLTNNPTATILPPTLPNRQFFSRTGLPIEAMDGHLRSRLEMGEDLSGAMQMSRTPVVQTGAEFRPQHLSDRQLANARLQVEETIGNSTILPPTLYSP